MTEIGLLSTVEQIALVRSGDLSSRELTEHFIERIERLDPEINAVVTRDFEVALEQADVADEQGQKGKLIGALHGIPITVKDALETRNLRSTGGAVELKDNVPDRDAAVVASLRREGAIVMGKTNFLAGPEIFSPTTKYLAPPTTLGIFLVGREARLEALRRQ